MLSANGTLLRSNMFLFPLKDWSGVINVVAIVVILYGGTKSSIGDIVRWTDRLRPFGLDSFGAVGTISVVMIYTERPIKNKYKKQSARQFDTRRSAKTFGRRS